MTPNELTARVVTRTLVLSVPATAAAATVGGEPAALGVLTGGALALFNFQWLAAAALAVSAAAGAPRRAWWPGAALRLGVVLLGGSAVVASGWAHPVALVAGVTLLPCAVVLAGLGWGRREPPG
jgi:hypothetical protein